MSTEPPQLDPLPPTFAATTRARHRVAEQVLAPAEPGGKEQRAGEWEVWQTSLHNPDFSAYARNCGALGIRVTDAAELDAALAEAVAHDGAAMVEVITDPNLV
jgi:hypothetical protein